MTNTNWNSEDIITIDTSVNEDITLDAGTIYNTSTIDVSSIANTGTITLDDPHWADNITWEQTEFEDTMPSLAKVENMCKEYPALDKAYENFRTVYAMVHQDWIGKNKDEELPF